MPKQNFLGQKSQVKTGLPLVAVAIVVSGALIVLGLTVLVQPQDNGNREINKENQNTNDQILLPLKNSAQTLTRLTNFNLSPTGQENKAEEEPELTFNQTYSNREYNFAISYPKEYTNQESKPAGALLAVSFLGPAENIPVITIYSERSGASEVENALAQNISSSIKIEKKKYANIEATQITTASWDATSATGAKRVIWEHDNYLFELTGVKSDIFLNEMLNTFAWL